MAQAHAGRLLPLDAFARWLAANGYTLPKFREEKRDDLVVETRRQQTIEGAANPEEAKRRESQWRQTLRKKAYIKIL